jgi:hypothetical protein
MRLRVKSQSILTNHLRLMMLYHIIIILHELDLITSTVAQLLIIILELRRKSYCQIVSA